MFVRDDVFEIAGSHICLETIRDVLLCVALEIHEDRIIKVEKFSGLSCHLICCLVPFDCLSGFFIFDLLQIYDVFVPGVDDDFSCVIVTSFLVLHDNLMLARFHKSRKAVHILAAFPLPEIDLLLSQALAALNFLRQGCLRHVTDEYISLRVRQIVFKAIKPVLVLQRADLLPVVVFQPLGKRQYGPHSTFTLATAEFLNVFLIKEEVEHGDFSHRHNCIPRDTAKN